MKRALAILCSVLLIAALPAALAEEQATGFTVPDLYKTISAQLDRTQLPADLPAETAAITAATLNGSSISVELNTSVPTLAVVQYTDDEDFTVCATNENASSISVDNLDDSQGVARIIMGWELAGGALSSEWIVLEGGVFEFVQSQYTAEAEGSQFAPFSKEIREISLDRQGQVLSDTRTLNNETDSFTLTMEYEASGKLTNYSCEWSRNSDGSWFFLRSSADRVPSGISWHNESADFTAVSDDTGDYLAGTGVVLDAIDYNDSFLTALEDTYPQLPEPRDDYPIEMAAATPTDLAADVQGTLWCIGVGPEESCTWQPFITADPLFILGENTVSLNGEARDVNGTAPSFSGQIPALPAFELPAVK